MQLKQSQFPLMFSSFVFNLKFILRFSCSFLCCLTDGTICRAGFRSGFPVERCAADARNDVRIPPPPDLTYSFCYWLCSFPSGFLSVVLLFVLLSETLRHLSPNRVDFVHLSRQIGRASCR